MAAARSRHDVARLLRARDLPASPVDETFVAVLAAQARDAAGTAAVAPPRRALRIAGAAVAVLASTVGVAVAANQGLFVPPAPQHTPPVTAPSDTAWPSPVDADDPAEETDDRAAEQDASEKSAPLQHREDAPDADDLATEETENPAPVHRGPAKPQDDATTGGAGGQDRPGDGPGDDESDESDGADDGSEDGPDGSESPEPEESESDEPESDDGTDEGADSSETSDPEPDQATESAGVDDSEDTASD